MAAFEYLAFDEQGRKKKGVLDGDSARQVRQKLREQGLSPISVSSTSSQSKQTATSKQKGRRGMSVSDLSLMTRQLATLIQSGMPLESCLRAVEEQTEKQRIKSVIAHVRAKVNEGYSLAEGLADYPGTFDQLFRSMVAAGEKSGHLDLILNRLAEYTENRQKMNSKLLQALLYPMILVFVSTMVVAILMIAVVPEIVGQFLTMGQALPMSTQILIGISDFFRNWWIVFVVGVVLLSSGTKAILKKPDIRLRYDQRMITFPVIGKVIRGLNTSRFSRTLAICSSSNIPILEGMQIAGDVVTNQYMKMKVREASAHVREGSSLRNALTQTHLFPPLMLHMIASGEQSGELENMLVSAADNQDNQFESTVNIALGIFTPALIVLMACVVFFIVMATMMPIMEMNNLMV